MTTREMALFGQLLLQKGVWNGERIVSEQWLALATAMQPDGAFRLRLMLLNGPQRVDLEFRANDGSVGVTGAVKGICGCELE